MPSPASCPLRLARSHSPAQEITGAPEAAQPGPAPRPPEEEGGHCRPLLQLPQPWPGLREAPWELTKLPPTRSCQPPPARLWTGPPGPGLLKWQVQSGNEVMSKLGVGCTWARSGRVCMGQMATGVSVCTRVCPAPGPTAGVWIFGRKECLKPSVQQRKSRARVRGDLDISGASLRLGRTVLVLQRSQKQLFLLICKPRYRCAYLGICSCLEVCAYVPCVCVCVSIHTGHVLAFARECMCVHVRCGGMCRYLHMCPHTLCVEVGMYVCLECVCADVCEQVYMSVCACRQNDVSLLHTTIEEHSWACVHQQSSPH